MSNPKQKPAEVLLFLKPKEKPDTRGDVSRGQYEVYVACPNCAASVKYATGACSQCGNSMGEWP